MDSKTTAIFSYRFVLDYINNKVMGKSLFLVFALFLIFNSALAG